MIDEINARESKRKDFEIKELIYSLKENVKKLNQKKSSLESHKSASDRLHRQCENLNALVHEQRVELRVLLRNKYKGNFSKDS